MKTKKICIIGSVHWSAAMGGSEYQIRLIVEELRKNEEFEIYFLTHNLADDYKPDGYRIKKLELNKILSRYATFFGIMSAYKHIAEIKPDIIYQRGSSALLYGGGWYSSRHGCKLIWHVASDSNLVEKIKPSKIYQINRFADRKIFEYGIKKAHVIIAQTECQASLAGKYNKTANVRVIKNFQPLPNNTNYKKKNQIVWVANIKDLKQPELFIELAKTLSRKIDIQCIMIGSPTSYPRKYQQMLEEKMKNVKNLKYVGKQTLESVNKYINESKIFINTSAWEGFPNTYIQAWMRGTPVITINCDPDNIIKNFGLGFHSRTFENLVEDTLQLLSDDDLRNSMGHRAKEYALKYHSLENLSEVVDIMYA